MGKFILASMLTVRLENYGPGRPYPYIQLYTPHSYSLFDWIQIIKMCTNYTDTYDWTFRNPYDENKKLSLYNDRDIIDNTPSNVFQGITPYVVCTHGPIKIHLGKRGFKKYGKVYPTVYLQTGKFPTEEEFVSGIKISDEVMRITQNKDDLKDLGEKLKVYFMNKYKISDEIDEESTFKANKLVRK